MAEGMHTAEIAKLRAALEKANQLNEEKEKALRLNQKALRKALTELKHLENAAARAAAAEPVSHSHHLLRAACHRACTGLPSDLP